MNQELSVPPVMEPRTIDDARLRRIIETVTLESGVSPVGTYHYQVFRYPGDIDMFEKIRYKMNRHEFLKTTAQRIQNIVQSVVLSDDIFYIEMKIGEDQRMDFDLGQIDDIDINIEHRHSFTEFIVRLYKTGNLTKNEASGIAEKVKKVLSGKDTERSDTERSDTDTLESLKSEIRELKMLRWSAAEVIRGYKDIRGGGKITIEEALNMQTLTKLDTLIWYNNRYIELTNFLYFELMAPDGTVTVVSKPFEDYYESLISDIRKYGGCDDENHRDRLKALKRTFVKNSLLYRTSNNNAIKPQLIKEMEEIAEVVNAEPGALSQIKADFEAIDTVISRFRTVDIKNICLMLNNMAKRFSININNPQLIEEFNSEKNKLILLYIDYLAGKTKNDCYDDFIKSLRVFSGNWLKKLKQAIDAKTSSLMSNNNLSVQCSL